MHDRMTPLARLYFEIANDDIVIQMSSAPPWAIRAVDELVQRGFVTVSPWAWEENYDEQCRRIRRVP
jgi:hypothetical protein